MSAKIKLKSGKPIFIANCNWQNDDFRKLYLIFRLTICPGMSEAKFEAYYKSQKLEYIDVSFFYTGEVIAGFCAAAFYKAEAAGKSFIIARSATGILPEYRGHALNKWLLYRKYMRYKWQHLSQKLILTIYASNPLIYSMVCKYTGIVYPRTGQQVPNSIIYLKDEILKNNGLQKQESAPFVVQINFEVTKTEQLKTVASTSKNRHIRFFVDQTGLQYRSTLLLIIPVSLVNILMCIGRFLFYFITRSLRQCKHTVPPAAGSYKKRNNLFSRFFTVRKINYASRKGM